MIWQDERLSTLEARQVLEAGGVKRQDMKKNIDSVAAAIILKEYMSGLNK